jgi:hypothetical protein
MLWKKTAAVQFQSVSQIWPHDDATNTTWNSPIYQNSWTSSSAAGSKL